VCIGCFHVNLWSQDYVFFIQPPQFYGGKRSRFTPSVDDCWYGRVALLFAFHVRTDQGSLMECKCAMIETLWDYCPDEGPVDWWRGTAHIGTKVLYMPAPEPRVWIVPVSSILGRLPLVPVGDTGTIPFSMASKQQAYFPQGTCDQANAPGSGSKLFYINTWAMVWPSDHPVLAE
jgi:hypothetical protein